MSRTAACLLLYADAQRLQLRTGIAVEAVVRAHAGAGARPKCLLLHGNPGSLHDWQQLLPLLARFADVAAIDLPGFGRSPSSDPDPKAFSLDRLAAHALAAADALGWQNRFWIVGHSHGGGVAQVAAVQQPQRIAGLALLATLGARAHSSYRLLALPGAGALMRPLAWLFGVRGLHGLVRSILRGILNDVFSPEPVSSADLEAQLELLRSNPQMLVSMAAVTRHQPCAQLFACASAIPCPTLFVHGTHDKVVPLAFARTLHDRIRSGGGQSEFHSIARAGHMFIGPHASTLAELIAGLLQERHEVVS